MLVQFLSVAPFLVPVLKSGLGSLCSWVGKREGFQPIQVLTFSVFLTEMEMPQIAAFWGTKISF